MVLSSGVAAQQSVTLEANEEMVEAASALLATVAGGPGGDGDVARLRRSARTSRSLSADEARDDWAYWPTERVGVPLDLMTARATPLDARSLTSLLSARGYLKVVQIMQLEQILGMLDTAGLPRGVGHYEVVLFGTPSTDGSLVVALRRPPRLIERRRRAGRHFSVTPSFFGSNPAEVRSGPLTGFRVLGAEEDLARDLVTSLTAAQRSKAVVSAEAPRDIFAGNINKPAEQWEAWRATLQPEGIPVAELNEVQQHWVRRILDEVVGVYRPELSADFLRAIDPKTLELRLDGRDGARRAALLPAARRRLRVRVRQRAGQRQPRALGVAQQVRGLRHAACSASTTACRTRSAE